MYECSLRPARKRDRTSSNSSPFTSQTLIQDRSVFELVWQHFESGIAEQRDVNQSMLKIVKELDLNQVLNMLNAVQDALKTEAPSSVPFALFLDFKCKIIDCLLQLWSLEKLRVLHTLLHPLECVYMILTSTDALNSQDDSDGVDNLFGNDIMKAYHVFSYLMLWINWKVSDPFFCDERYFRTYFKNYSKSERKKVLSGIAIDILEFLSRNELHLAPDFTNNLQDIVPLLSANELLLFWKFYNSLDLVEKERDYFFGCINELQMSQLTSSDFKSQSQIAGNLSDSLQQFVLKMNKK